MHCGKIPTVSFMSKCQFMYKGSFLNLAYSVQRVANAVNNFIHLATVLFLLRLN